MTDITIVIKLYNIIPALMHSTLRFCGKNIIFIFVARLQHVNCFFHTVLGRYYYKSKLVPIPIECINTSDFFDPFGIDFYVISSVSITLQNGIFVNFFKFSGVMKSLTVRSKNVYKVLNHPPTTLNVYKSISNLARKYLSNRI